jgi:hypothetical protein
MGVLADPRGPGTWPCRDNGFLAEVFLYSFAKGPSDEHGTPPDHGTPPADALAPPACRAQRAHPGGLPSRRPATRRPLPHTARPPHRTASPRLLPPPQERAKVCHRIAGHRLQRHQVLLLAHRTPRLDDAQETPGPQGQEAPRRALGRGGAAPHRCRPHPPQPGLRDNRGTSPWESSSHPGY